MKYLVILPMLFLFIVGCTSASTTTEESTHNFEILQQLINSKTFEIEADWANPLGGNRVNLIGNSNYFRMEEDLVDVYLPYFGVRRSGYVYGNSNSIEFKGAYKNFKVNEKSSRNEIILNFDIRENTENYSVQVSIFANGKSTIFVESSQRDSIRYDGNIVASTKNQ